MKSVLHCITTICRGGAETQLLVLARQQVLSGNQVTVLYLKGVPELREDFVSAGVTVVDSLAGHSPVLQVLMLRQYLKRHSFDVVHNHLPRAELLFRLTFVDMPYVFSRHNAEPFFPGAPVSVSRALSLFATSGRCKGIAISSAVREFSKKNREISTRESLEVIYYGFDPLSRAVMGSIRRDREFTFGTVARLVPQKNLPTLLQAFAVIATEGLEANLIIIGDGVDAKELARLAYKLGISHRITWVPKSHDVPKAMSEIETFILPSLYEGFGLVLLEAMSAECAILASNNSAIPEVLGENFLGLFETKSIPELSLLMKQTQSKAFREKLIETQLNRLKLFTPEVMEYKIDTLYTSLLK